MYLILISNLQMRKMKLREVKHLAQDHTAGRGKVRI